MVDAAGLQDRAFANNRIGDLGVNQLARGQIARTCVDGEFLVVETEGGRGLLGQREVGFIERTDGANVFPVCLLYTSPSPRDATLSRMPSSA